MVSFPNAKINIGLHITGKRPDGFHNLETVFYPVMLRDALEIIELPSHQQDDIQYSCSGFAINGRESDNLCIKAYHLLKKDFPELPAVSMHLHKGIPMGAGLGGGSADAAFMLLLLNKKFGLQITGSKLIDYAAQLGSDCPFFILNTPSYATGRGEVLEETGADLSDYKILVVYPGIHINTGEAFKTLKLQPARTDLRKAILQPVETWKEVIVNDFETTVFENHPSVKALKESLYTAGASFAMMSGSGSTVYGIFKKEIRPVLNFPAGYFYKWV